MNVKNYSISVIIPTFNRILSVERAIISVNKQTLPPQEIIVIDNGSTDGTSNYLKKKFPNLKIVYETKKGVSSARNRGIIEAKSFWIAFLDSDDEWLPKKLENQMNAYKKNSKDFSLIHCDEYWIKNKKYINPQKKHKKKGGYIFFECVDICCISPSSVLIKKSKLIEAGLFDCKLKACEDYDLWLRICLFDPVLFLDQKLLNKYGGHDDQLSKKYWGMDRFRIYSLEKILYNYDIDEQKREKIIEKLKEKLLILINGAKKRNNNKIISKYEKKLFNLQNE